MLDISKLVVGGAVITSAIDITSDKTTIILTALGVSVLFMIIGLGMQYWCKIKL